MKTLVAVILLLTALASAQVKDEPVMLWTPPFITENPTSVNTTQWLFTPTRPIRGVRLEAVFFQYDSPWCTVMPIFSVKQGVKEITVTPSPGQSYADSGIVAVDFDANIPVIVVVKRASVCESRTFRNISLIFQYEAGLKASSAAAGQAAKKEGR